MARPRKYGELSDDEIWDMYAASNGILTGRADLAALRAELRRRRLPYAISAGRRAQTATVPGTPEQACGDGDWMAMAYQQPGPDLEAANRQLETIELELAEQEYHDLEDV